MHWVLALLFAAFWEAKPPEKWTEMELDQIMKDSPWARDVGTELFLASALPMVEAEKQYLIRHGHKPGAAEKPGPSEDDWREYLANDRGKHVVLAVRVPFQQWLSDAAETKRMEEGSTIRAGKTKAKMVGHFPPTAGDPYLRMLFPRIVDPKAKSFKFVLYLPGVSKPFREVEFYLNEMTYNGKLEY